MCFHFQTCHCDSLVKHKKQISGFTCMTLVHFQFHRRVWYYFTRQSHIFSFSTFRPATACDCRCFVLKNQISVPFPNPPLRCSGEPQGSVTVHVFNFQTCYCDDHVRRKGVKCVKGQLPPCPKCGNDTAEVKELCISSEWLVSFRGPISLGYRWFKGKVKSRFMETHIRSAKKTCGYIKKILSKGLFLAPDCTKLISRLRTCPGEHSSSGKNTFGH